MYHHAAVGTDGVAAVGIAALARFDAEAVTAVSGDGDIYGCGGAAVGGGPGAAVFTVFEGVGRSTDVAAAPTDIGCAGGVARRYDHCGRGTAGEQHHAAVCADGVAAVGIAALARFDAEAVTAVSGNGDVYGCGGAAVGGGPGTAVFTVFECVGRSTNVAAAPTDIGCAGGVARRYDHCGRGAD